MADIKDGAVLSGVHVRHDVTVFVLDGHAPAGKLHHLPTLGPVEVKQGRLLQGSLEEMRRHHDSFSFNFNKDYHVIILE